MLGTRDKQGERFNQEMKIRYRDRWNAYTMADFCWMLERHIKKKDRKCKRNALHLSLKKKLFKVSD